MQDSLKFGVLDKLQLTTSRLRGTMNDSICSKCVDPTKMTPGYIHDPEYKGVAESLSWVESGKGHNPLTGTVTFYRCPKCGYIELYLHEKDIKT